MWSAAPAAVLPHRPARRDHQAGGAAAQAGRGPGVAVAQRDVLLAGRQAPLPPLFEGQMDATEIIPAPEEGGPFHSPSSGVSAVAQKEPRSAEAQDMEKLDNV